MDRWNYSRWVVNRKHRFLDGNQIIADSTEIAKYLDSSTLILAYSNRSEARGAYLEEWADESIGVKSRKVLFGALSQDQNFRKSFYLNNTRYCQEFSWSATQWCTEGFRFGVGFMAWCREVSRSRLEARQKRCACYCLIAHICWESSQR